MTNPQTTYIIVYDINVETDKGRTLRAIAKTCEKYGTRIQNSFFTAHLTPGQHTKFISALSQNVRPDMDTIHIIPTTNSAIKQCTVLGLEKPSYLPTDTII